MINRYFFPAAGIAPLIIINGVAVGEGQPYVHTHTVSVPLDNMETDPGEPFSRPESA